MGADLLPTGKPPTPPQGDVPKWTLAVVCIATFMLMLDVTAATIALKGIGTTFQASFADLQWVVDAYTLTLAAFLLTSGSLADRLGRKRVFNAGLVIFAVSSLAIGLAPDITSLNIFRAIQGVGAAVLYAVGPALIGHEFLGADRGKAFGALGGVAGLAIAVGPIVGGFLTSGNSWRWIFLINVPVGIFALIKSARWIRESRQPQDYGLDWTGTLTFAGGLGLLVLAFLRSGAHGWTGDIITALAIGGALLVAFVLIELRRGRTAMFDLSLFRNASFSGVALATLLSNAAVLSAIVLQLFYMQSVLGLSAWETGVRFIPQTFTVFFVAMITGAVLINRVSPGLLVGTAIGFIAGGIALACLVEPGSTWVVLLPSMIATGIGMGLFNPPRAAITIGVVEPSRAGMASGMGESFQQVGVAVGIAAFGAMFHRYVVEGFVASEVGQALGDGAAAAGESIVVQGQRALADAVPGHLAADAVAAGEAAFVSGFNAIMLVCAVTGAVGAVLALVMIRRSDLHASALAGAEAPDASALDVAGASGAPVPEQGMG